MTPATIRPNALKFVNAKFREQFMIFYKAFYSLSAASFIACLKAWLKRVGVLYSKAKAILLTVKLEKRLEIH